MNAGKKWMILSYKTKKKKKNPKFIMQWTDLTAKDKKKKKIKDKSTKRKKSKVVLERYKT